MVASGTRARIACALPRGSRPSTRPRRELRSPMTSPRYSSGVTTSTAGLAHEAPFDLLDGLPEGLAVGDLRAADVRVDRELAQQPVDDDLEVELAHPGDQRLARLVVGSDAEGRILL